MKRLLAVIGVVGGLLGISVSHLMSAGRTSEELAPPTKCKICHKPGTEDEQEMLVPQSAVAGHLGHGDRLGPCGDDGGDKGR